MTTTLVASLPFYEGWPRRLARALHHEGVRSWDDLTRLSFARLLCYPGVSGESIRFIREQLTERGLTHAPGAQPVWQAPNLTALSLPALCGVYFAQCGPYIKIGYARDIHRRLRGIETMVPFEVTLVLYVACEPVDAPSIEMALHQQFRAHHHRGEWFRYEGALERYLADETAARE